MDIVNTVNIVYIHKNVLYSHSYKLSLRVPIDSQDSAKTENMSTERVKSKNLFNFRPTGVVDADIQAYEEKMMAEMGGDPEEMIKQFNALPDDEYVAAMRSMLDGYIEGESYFNHHILKEVGLILTSISYGSQHI